MKGQRLEVWEVFLTQQEADEFLNDVIDNPNTEKYNNLTQMFERKTNGYTSLPAPAVVRTSMEPTENVQTGSLRIRPGRLADTYVPNLPGLVQVTFEISGAFASWMSHKRRMPMMKKLIRSVIVVCPKCDSRLDPVDVNKVNSD